MNNLSKIKSTLNYAIITICLASVLYMVLTLVWTTSYSVFVEDDFTIIDMIEGMDHNVLSYLRLAGKNIAETYMGWQGTYLGCFLYVILNPVGQAGLVQERWVMSLNSSLFFISLLLFLVVSLKKLGLKLEAVSAVIISVIVFSLCGYQTYPEIFFWFTGAVVYSFPMSILLITLSIFLLDSDNIATTSISSVLGIISMGGALLISGAGCYTALLVLVYEYFTQTSHKDLHRKPS